MRIRKIDPDMLWKGDIESSFMEFTEMVDLLAIWAMHNTQRQVPLVVFDWHKIEDDNDLFRVLQM